MLTKIIMHLLNKRITIASFILLFLIIGETFGSHEVLLNYSIQFTKKDMPECLYETKNPRNGIIIFYDKISKQLPRKIFYSRMDNLRYAISDNYNRESISSCRGLRFVDTQKLEGNEINLDETEIILEQFKLNTTIIQRLKQLKEGHSKYLKSVDLADESYRDLLNDQFKTFNLSTHKVLLKDYGVKTTSKMYSDYISTKNYDSCAPLVGTCEYYLCRESKKSCGAQGYFVGFGYQYCSQSLENLIHQVSPIGKKWIISTATCLQRKMQEENDQKTCSELKESAIESHSECYSEISFCSMKLSDIQKIFKMIYPELTDAKILKEGMAVLKECVK